VLCPGLFAGQFLEIVYQLKNKAALVLIEYPLRDFPRRSCAFAGFVFLLIP